MKKTITLFLAATVLGAASLSAEPVIYKIDTVHSGIDFRIRHFINRVPGTFGNFEGEIHFDKANPQNSKAVATIHVNTVDTRNADRDAHLRNPDFFNVAEHPVAEFVSTTWQPTGENTFDVTGNLTMMGITREVVLKVEFLGEVEGRGTMRSGWEARTRIDRTDWGITFGTPAIGRDVDIEINLQGHRQ